MEKRRQKKRVLQKFKKVVLFFFCTEFDMKKHRDNKETNKMKLKKGEKGERNEKTRRDTKERKQKKIKKKSNKKQHEDKKTEKRHFHSCTQVTGSEKNTKRKENNKGGKTR